MNEEEKREAIAENFLCYKQKINSFYTQLDDTICNKLYDDENREKYLKRIITEIEDSKTYFVDRILDITLGRKQ
jgi:hypothetical protein